MTTIDIYHRPIDNMDYVRLADHENAVEKLTPQFQDAEDAPHNLRVLIYGTNHLGADECAMAWRDRIDNKWYYAPQGSLVQWKPDTWTDIPKPKEVQTTNEPCPIST